MHKNLNSSLKQAIAWYDPNLDEEQGGFILNKDNLYEFIGIKNTNTGTRTARSLYTAELTWYCSEVLGNWVADKGYRIFASFHTHPFGYPALPSVTDLTKLFTSFSVNYIYAPKEKVLNQFKWSKIGWEKKQINLTKN